MTMLHQFPCYQRTIQDTSKINYFSNLCNVVVIFLINSCPTTNKPRASKTARPQNNHDRQTLINAIERGKLTTTSRLHWTLTWMQLCSAVLNTRPKRRKVENPRGGDEDSRIQFFTAAAAAAAFPSLGIFHQSPPPSRRRRRRRCSSSNKKCLRVCWCFAWRFSCHLTHAHNDTEKTICKRNKLTQR